MRMFHFKLFCISSFTADKQWWLFTLHYAESELLRSWEMQNPQNVWQTENQSYHKIHSTFQMITKRELLAGRVRRFQRNELTTWRSCFPQHSTVKVCKNVLMYEKQWRNVESGSVSMGCKLCVCVWTVYLICCSNTAHQEMSLLSHK